MKQYQECLNQIWETNHCLQNSNRFKINFSFDSHHPIFQFFRQWQRTTATGENCLSQYRTLSQNVFDHRRQRLESDDDSVN